MSRYAFFSRFRARFSSRASELLAHPQVALIASAVALLLAVASALDAANRLEAMGAVKNLTLARAAPAV